MRQPENTKGRLKTAAHIFQAALTVFRRLQRAIETMVETRPT
ncbi:hypothetical protein HMPREF9123_0946 [Neisseria bacilliformis ATCC BAA-1200]|uniref:Uncharacterized protein n=1 Tax=Neisseria bacilliformis ATCC BAA-1200 TaxID=888742 RepID=F2BB42_9NEIS|nr:hypothetical protein HMPREF9123_0946 [Neisseria bacilliformis ATCC BAA-1200]